MQTGMMGAAGLARRVKLAAIGFLAALALAAGGAAAAPSDAEAKMGDGFYYCLAAGGNFMECWYWWNFQT